MVDVKKIQVLFRNQPVGIRIPESRCMEIVETIQSICEKKLPTIVKLCGSDSQARHYSSFRFR